MALQMHATVVRLKSKAKIQQLQKEVLQRTSMSDSGFPSIAFAPEQDKTSHNDVQ